ncbi:MAG: hypothetical protein L6R40_008744, partial [Gallowayella cf. fulva]
MVNHYNPSDRLPLWKIVKAIGVSQREVTRLLREAELPLSLDYETGQAYTSEEAFRLVVMDALTRLSGDRLPKPRPESLEAVARFLDTNADPDAVVRVGFEDMAEKLTVPVEDLMVDLRVIIDAGLIEKADITSLYAKIVYPPVWEWDGSKPLESAREWETSMLSCRHIGSAAKNLASLYRAVGHMTNGEGYLSIEFGMDVLDCNERNLKKRR